MFNGIKTTTGRRYLLLEILVWCSLIVLAYIFSTESKEKLYMFERGSNIQTIKNILDAQYSTFVLVSSNKGISIYDSNQSKQGMMHLYFLDKTLYKVEIDLDKAKFTQGNGNNKSLHLTHTVTDGEYVYIDENIDFTKAYKSWTDKTLFKKTLQGK